MPNCAGHLRTLPLWVAPLPGEAIDSWLEAIADRHQAAYGAVLVQCGIDVGRISGRRLIAPPLPTIDNIAHVARVGPDIVRAMTLTPREGALIAGRRYREAWGWRIGSRACPGCLAETGGRWMLSWRHNLAFACLTHRCLLIDTCQVCEKPLRERHSRLQLVPVPGCCANPQPYLVSAARQPCGADLTKAVSICLHTQHPVLRAQRHVDALCGCAPSGLRPALQQPGVTGSLSDITALARWMASNVGSEDLECVMDTLHDVPAVGRRSWSTTTTSAKPPHTVVHPTAANTAVSVVLALAVLNGRSHSYSRNLLQRILSATMAGCLTRASAHRIRSQLTPRANAIFESAFEKAYNDTCLQSRLAVSASRQAKQTVLRATNWRR